MRGHEAFARRFLELNGWRRHQLRVETCPRGSQAGEQWVRERYPVEVEHLRAQPFITRALIVIRDGDLAGGAARVRDLDAELSRSGLRPRAADDPVVAVIPCRNIETWLAFLRGQTVDETTEYPRLPRARDCAPLVAELKRMCEAGALRLPAPPSLERACHEYRTRLP